MRLSIRLSAGFTVMAIATGLSAAAQNSLPGDVLLYNVKIHINEPLLGLAFTAEGRTNAALKQARIRLREAERLGALNRLSWATATSNAEAFEAHAMAVVQGIDTLARGNARAGATVAALFAADLNAHGTILQGLHVPQTEKLTARIAKVQTSLAVTGNRATRALLSGRAGADMQTDAGLAIKAAESDFRTVSAMVSAARTADGLHAAADDLQLSVAWDALATARSKMEDKAYAEAFELALRANTQTHAVGIALESAGDAL